MSYQIHSYDIINDLNDRDQFNDYPVDNEQYFLFNGQDPTPQGNEIDPNTTINIIRKLIKPIKFQKSLFLL